ncbi:ABC transporter substrate-binding protein [Aerococcus sp. Group 2]|uniref:ABC transporter substrate-binding protein n=1 Tax=Aerococcus sp. Group 2 TaxID=2976811 RepID=UPI003FA3A31E
MMKKYLRYLVAGLLTCTLAACSNQGKETSKDKVDVGIIQYMEHDSLQKAKEGFQDSLKEAGYEEGKNLAIEFHNSQGDQSNLQSITQQLKGKKDLILSIATPAAQAMLNTDKETPQLFTAVTDPVGAKLVESKEKPGKNMTGTSNLTPVGDVVNLLLKADPSIKTIGILYNSSEMNAQVQYEQAKEYIESKGLKVETMTVTSTNDVQQATKILAEKVDGIYLPTDNTIANTIQTIGKVLMETKTPSVAAFDAAIEGSLCAYGVDYYKLGQQTGNMAIDILKGDKKPADIPVEMSKDMVIKVNDEMAAALGMDSEELKARLKG